MRDPFMRIGGPAIRSGYLEQPATLSRQDSRAGQQRPVKAKSHESYDPIVVRSHWTRLARHGEFGYPLRFRSALLPCQNSSPEVLCTYVLDRRH